MEYVKCVVCGLSFPEGDLDVTFGTCSKDCSDNFMLAMSEHASWDYCMCCNGPLDDQNKEYCDKCTRETFLDTGNRYLVLSFQDTCWEIPYIFGLDQLRPEKEDIPF